MSSDDASEAVDFEGCEAILQYRFSDRSLLESALTHASGANHRLASNERMEFLGDAILGAVVCEQLYERFPDFLEGDLTKLKSVVVSRLTCAKLSRELGLERFLILGKGMTTSPTVPQSVMADVFESLVAAIYLDGGRDAAAEFVNRLTEAEIDQASADGVGGENFKSLLQQLVQREEGTTPNYCLVDEQGPDHSKAFQVAVKIGDRRFTAAWGKTKKESEQRAAANALAELDNKSPPHPAELGEED